MPYPNDTLRFPLRDLWNVAKRKKPAEAFEDCCWLETDQSENLSVGRFDTLGHVFKAVVVVVDFFEGFQVAFFVAHFFANKG